jgi:hypothetical protein
MWFEGFTVSSLGRIEGESPVARRPWPVILSGHLVLAFSVRRPVTGDY